MPCKCDDSGGPRGAAGERHSAGLQEICNTLCPQTPHNHDASTARHVDVLVAVKPAARQARIEAQGRVCAEDVLVERVVVAVDVVRHLP